MLQVKKINFSIEANKLAVMKIKCGMILQDLKIYRK